MRIKSKMRDIIFNFCDRPSDKIFSKLICRMECEVFLFMDELYYSEQDKNHVCGITPIEFEKYCREILLGYAEKENLINFSIVHDVKLPSYDGEYQIDLYATFTALNVEMKVICECKHNYTHK